MTELKPVSIGRIVLYTVTEKDAHQINKRRQDALDKDRGEPEDGVQIHFGNQVVKGMIFPLIITRVWARGVINGQVFLDGNDTLWVRSVAEEPAILDDTSSAEGTWHWPSLSIS